MIDAVAPTRSRRLPFGAIIIALVISALGGVFVLLWFKLPTWAPEWVVEHSPWVDPIVRAVEENPSIREEAVRRLVGMGESVVPRMVEIITHQDQTLSVEVFSLLTDNRAIVPMIEQILIPERSDPRFVTSAPPAKDSWIPPLRHQNPSAVTDHLLPHLRPGVEIPYQLLDVAGRIDDHRLVDVLRQLLHQPWKPENLRDGRLDQEPTVRAAKALVESPCPSAVPVLVESFGNADPAIRLRVVFGILVTTHEGGRFREFDWDARVKQLILAGATDADSQVRQTAAMCMGMKEIDGSEPHMIRLSYAGDPGERSAAVFALRMNKPSQEAQGRIIALLKDPDPKVCLYAVDGISSIDDPASVTGDLIDLLSSPSDRLRGVICSTLGRKQHCSHPRVFAAMLTAMDDPSSHVAQRAEMTAWGAASTPEQKAAVEAKSEAVKQRRSGAGHP